MFVTSRRIDVAVNHWLTQFLSILSPRGLHHVKVGFIAPNMRAPEEDGLHFIKLIRVIIQSRVFWKSILKLTTDSNYNIYSTLLTVDKSSFVTR